MIFYLDGWKAATDGKEFSKSPRYRGLFIVVGGGVISPILDKFLLETEKYVFFKGYLFGVIIGWLILFISISFSYIFWKNTEKLSQNSISYKIGQICLSFIQVVSGGIIVDPIKLKELENQQTENQFAEVKEKLKKEDPQAYIALEEQLIQSQQRDLNTRRENLENLKIALARANSEPEQEAEKLIQDKNLLIQTLQTELELARSRRQDDKHIKKIIEEYTTQLRHQEDEIRELRELIQNFRQQNISQSKLSQIVSFKRINQYEFGGLFIGELAVHGRLIKIYQGDIASLVIDVIVSSDDNYLSMGGGVSYRIRSAGGSEIYSEAKKLAPLSLGEVAVTTAGKLSAQSIFHGVVIDFNTGKGPSKQVIQQVIHTCFKKANEANYRSIAFPLLGTGNGGFPAIEALQFILSQVIKELSDEHQSIAEVIIAIYGTVAQVIDVETLIKEIQSD